MADIITFPVPDASDKEAIARMMDHLKETTDQIIFIQRTHEGHLAMGHSALSSKDLVVMYHQIQRYILALLESDPDEEEGPYVN